MEFKALIDKLYNEKNFEIRRYIPDKLAKLGDWDSTIHLGNILGNVHEPTQLRIECAESLGKQGDIRAIGILVQTVDTDIDELRRTIIWSLGQIGHPEAVPILVKHFSDRNLMVRRWVAKSLARIRDLNVHDYLIQFYNISPITDTHVKADILRAVVDQISTIESQQYEYWAEICIYNLKSESQVHITKSSAQLFELIVQNSELMLSAPVLELFDKYKENSIVGPYIFNCIGLIGLVDLLLESDINIHTLNALSLANYFEIHLKIINNPNDYSDDLVEISLRTLPGQYHLDLSYFHTSSHLGIRLASFILHGKNGDSFDVLKQDMNKNKLSYGIFEAFQYYPHETISFVIKTLDSPDKVMRQTALNTVVKSSYVNSYREEVIVALQRVANSDRVWHIRRDARNHLKDLQS